MKNDITMVCDLLRRFDELEFQTYEKFTNRETRVPRWYPTRIMRTFPRHN